MSSSQISSQADLRPAAASGTFTIGGDLPVHRLGFGAMRIVGRGAALGSREDCNRRIEGRMRIEARPETKLGTLAVDVEEDDALF